jgi:LysM repeat protein
MDLKYINRSFFFIAFFLTGILFRANAQVVVEKSNDKVIISGTTFYIHTVKKGETAYSVSRAYGVTIDELTKENPACCLWTKKMGADTQNTLQGGS